MNFRLLFTMLLLMPTPALASDDAPGHWVWHPILCNGYDGLGEMGYGHQQSWWNCAKSGTNNDFEVACQYFAGRRILSSLPPKTGQISGNTPGSSDFLPASDQELAALCNKADVCKFWRDGSNKGPKYDAHELTCDAH